SMAVCHWPIVLSGTVTTCVTPRSPSALAIWSPENILSAGVHGHYALYRRHTPSANRSVMSTRTIVITGASSGIGAELARQLGADGHSLVLAARRGQELERVAAAAVDRGSPGAIA